MRPLTTYTIPESDQQETPDETRWLLLFIPAGTKAAHEDLLKNVAASLNADYNLQVSLIEVNAGQPLGTDSYLHDQVKLIISFGIPVSQLGIWIDLSQPGMRRLEQFSLMLTVAPDDLSKSVAAKKELWSSIRYFLDQDRDS